LETIFFIHRRMLGLMHPLHMAGSMESRVVA